MVDKKIQNKETEMRKLNLTLGKKYKDGNGEEKTKWINIGSMVIQDDGKVFGEIDSIPVGITELRFNGFDRKEKQQPYQQPNYGGQSNEQN